MKFIYLTGTFGNYYTLLIYGNLGFNSGSTYDNQPGKFTGGYYNTNSTGFNNPAQFPLITQWVFVNQSGILVFFDANYNIAYSGTNVLVGRYIAPFFMGSIESYKSGETEGNILITTKSIIYGTYSPFFAIWSGLFNSATDSSHCSGEMYYLGASRSNGSVNSTISLGMGSASTPAVTAFQNKGFSYNWAVKMSSYTNKAPIIKPIISLSYSISGYNYFHPIGELPYYATAGYPYFLPGDTTYYGQRKFTVVEMGNYQYPYAVAIETGN
jgi:hypothetical protein